MSATEKSSSSSNHLDDDNIKKDKPDHNDDDEDYNEEEEEEHRKQICSGCDRIICLACHELEGGDEPALAPCECCETALAEEFCLHCRGTCKFCSTVVCPSCSLECGHCGIVLCPRDEKFAVECWNCHVPYCLVCLASLSSSSSSGCCPQCHAKPSKKMSQLVHLRLKSIYRAFQQQQQMSENHAAASDNAAATSSPSNTTNTTTVAAEDSSRSDAASGESPCTTADTIKSGKSIVMKRNEQGAWQVEETVEGGETTRRSLEEWQSTSSTAKHSLALQQEQADAAAADLLAQLEMEGIKIDKKKKRKKSKKKRKDGTAIQASSEGKEKERPRDNGGPKGNHETLDHDGIESEASAAVQHSQEAENEDEDYHLLSLSTTAPQKSSQEDKDEARLGQLIADRDEQGLETFLSELRGVPGQAGLRKNAKKALKRLVTMVAEKEGKEQVERVEVQADDAQLIKVISRATTNSGTRSGAVHQSYSKSESSSSVRAECILHMTPSLVGWVIGKGGTRIRDLMEDTATRIWIDQESMGPSEPRVVYVSGPQLSVVDRAVEKLKELVNSAPGYGSLAGGTKTEAHRAPTERDEARTGSVKQPQLSRSDESTGKSGSVCEIIPCDLRYVPLLIGRRGWTIKNIQDTSGARVDIDQTVIPRQIKILGKRHNVRSAVRMVQDVLSYPHAHLHLRGEQKKEVSGRGENLYSRVGDTQTLSFLQDEEISNTMVRHEGETANLIHSAGNPVAMGDSSPTPESSLSICDGLRLGSAPTEVLANSHAAGYGGSEFNNFNDQLHRAVGFFGLGKEHYSESLPMYLEQRSDETVHQQMSSASLGPVISMGDSPHLNSTRDQNMAISDMMLQAPIGSHVRAENRLDLETQSSLPLYNLGSLHGLDQLHSSEIHRNMRETGNSESYSDILDRLSVPDEPAKDPRALFDSQNVVSSSLNQGRDRPSMAEVLGHSPSRLWGIQDHGVRSEIAQRSPNDGFMEEESRLPEISNIVGDECQLFNKIQSFSDLIDDARTGETVQHGEVVNRANSGDLIGSGGSLLQSQATLGSGWKDHPEHSSLKWP